MDANANTDQWLGALNYERITALAASLALAPVATKSMTS